MHQTPSDLGSREARFAEFVATVWEHHRQDRRDLPWRRTHDPYEILVSEMMLQQTQVARVVQKYARFLQAFPTVAVLASAETSQVVAQWQGLGYNRRALALHRAAKMIVAQHDGRLPDSITELRRLPGVGPATAAALSAFAFGRAEAFVETNIRSAYIHFFFSGRDDVSDAEILPLVEQTMDRDDAREWFYALMDYGVWLKKTCGNPGRRSRHRTVQPPFAGSRREVRARILQALLAIAPAAVDRDDLVALLPDTQRQPDDLLAVAEALAREGFLERDGTAYRMAGAGTAPATT